MSILAAGFLIGMRHALDADHLAAITVLLADKPSARAAARQGALWGVGHCLTLLLVGALVIAADIQLSARLAHLLEMLVGLMLVVLGIDLLRRWYYQRSDQSTPTAPPNQLPRALGVGVMHGLAGSTALILLTLATLDSKGLAVSYILLFGLGSIAGMALLSVGLALSLSTVGKRHASVFQYTRAAASVVSISLGGLLMINAQSAL